MSAHAMFASVLVVISLCPFWAPALLWLEHGGWARVRFWWCRRTGGHRIDEVRLGESRGNFEIHRWCTRCGLHGVIKATIVRGDQS